MHLHGKQMALLLKVMVTCVVSYTLTGIGGPIGTRILLGSVLSYSIHFHLLLRDIQVPTAMLWLTKELGRRPC